MDLLLERIKSHEGFKAYAYQDSLSYWSIGYGKCIDRRKNCGISEEEAEVLLQNEITECQNELKHFHWWINLDEVRRDVLTELCFNIGLPSLLKFTKMLSSLQYNNFSEASKDLLDSEWATQVGELRSKDMAKRLETGSYS